MILLSYDFNFLPVDVSIIDSFLQSRVKTYLIDETETSGTNPETYPALLLYIVEFLVEKIHIETPLGTTLRVRHVIAYLCPSSCDLTNLRHCYLLISKSLITSYSKQGANLLFFSFMAKHFLFARQDFKIFYKFTLA
jgi:hypothetical protein